MSTNPRTFTTKKGILTVAQLKKMIANLPDETQVIIGTGDDWFNVEAVEIPDFEEHFFFNLMTADTFDSRQI